MTAKFNKYPMTKEEFNNRVTELFIEKYGDDEGKAKDFINGLIENDDYFDCCIQTPTIAMTRSEAMHSWMRN